MRKDIIHKWYYQPSLDILLDYSASKKIRVERNISAQTRKKAHVPKLTLRGGVPTPTVTINGVPINSARAVESGNIEQLKKFPPCSFWGNIEEKRAIYLAGAEEDIYSEVS